MVVFKGLGFTMSWSGVSCSLYQLKAPDGSDSVATSCSQYHFVIDSPIGALQRHYSKSTQQGGGLVGFLTLEAKALLDSRFTTALIENTFTSNHVQTFFDIIAWQQLGTCLLPPY